MPEFFVLLDVVSKIMSLKTIVMNVLITNLVVITVTNRISGIYNMVFWIARSCSHV
jgi:hypothetical protein